MAEKQIQPTTASFVAVIEQAPSLAAESAEQQHETAGNLYDDDDEDDLYNFDDDENENDMGYHTFKSTFTPVVRVM